MRAGIGASIAAAVIAVVAACSTYGETSGEPIAGGTDAGAEATNDAGANDATDTARGSFCATAKDVPLCDDFDDEVLPAAHWDSVEVQGVQDDTLSIVGRDAGAANPFLQMKIAKAIAGSESWANVLHEMPDGKTSVVLALSLRVSGFSASDEIEIASFDAVNGSDTVSLVMTAGRLRLAERGGNNVDVAAWPSTSQRFAVRLDVPAGTVTATDGATDEVLSTLRLDRAFTGRLRFALGLVYTNAASPGIVEIDDVTLDY